MIRNIIIIYIEGYKDQPLKQEKNLFELVSSRKIWGKYFNKMGFEKFLFKIIPKKFTSDKEKNNYYKILDRTIKNLLSISEENENKKFLYLLITGDHDENNDQELKCREKIANEIENIYKKNSNVSTKILLLKDKKFNIESIMSEIVGEKVNKKELKERINNEYPPTIPELMKFPKIEINEDDVVKNLINSKHILFKEIFNIKNKINKK